jgi:hypothetical protein
MLVDLIRVVIDINLSAININLKMIQNNCLLPKLIKLVIVLLSNLNLKFKRPLTPL